MDKELAGFQDSLVWPASSASTGALDADVYSNFTERYVDILPDGWNVLSLSLSADQSEIIVSRLRKSQSPFLLQLPLKRGNSADDIDEEPFTFEEGKNEMKEIITLANQSAHAARSLQNDKSLRREWWRNREALDRRLGTLLQNIESVWFGGFRGIFAPSPCEEGPFSQFRCSFESVLDNHLPSRRKGASGPRLTLHQDVLALFTGLGDLQDQEDPEDILMDLLYFVVDILQFQGERNAYDEIDFDIMVIETLDALRVYHQAVKNGQVRGQKKKQKKPARHHTILVLDKALHFFPWESLPGLQGLSVSRVPSLECLRDRILHMRCSNGSSSLSKTATTGTIDGSKGSYIVNPAGDLKSTQGTFQRKLSDLSSWNGIVNREPSEEEFKDALESKDVFLYFGHGSGAQYIRGRTIKRLSRCAVTFLMGCSSGTLTEAGEYEPYGTPMNYLHAGSPALVATLWDVTDKDIDRFAKSTLELWGLFRDDMHGAAAASVGDSDGGEGSVDDSRSGGYSTTSTSPESQSHDHSVALDEAVERSRGACLFRYLNGAAPVIYGVPVVLE